MKFSLFGKPPSHPTAPWKIALVDGDLRRLFGEMIGTIKNCELILEADTGVELTDEISAERCPDIVLLNVNLYDGLDTCVRLRDKWPDTKILGITLDKREPALIRMLLRGARGYVLHDVRPDDLKLAFEIVMKTGYYDPENSYAVRIGRGQ